MKENYCVYIHKTPNNKYYVGISKNPILRWGNNGKGYKKNVLFYRAIQKYGWENIEHRILFENLCEVDAQKKEIELIAQYKSNQKEYGYNISIGGDKTTSGYKFTKKQRVKLSEAKTRPVYCIEDNKIYYSGYELKQAGYERYREVCNGNRKTCKNKHFIFLDELEMYKKNQLQLKDGLRKRVICLETKKIYETIDSASKNTKTQASSISMCCYNKLKSTNNLHFQFYNNNFDINKCNEIIAKIDKDKWLTPKSTKVLCIETGVVYSCVSKATRETGITHISECCHNKRKIAGGFHWRFIYG